MTHARMNPHAHTLNKLDLGPSVEIRAHKLYPTLIFLTSSNMCSPSPYHTAVVRLFGNTCQLPETGPEKQVIGVDVRCV